MARSIAEKFARKADLDGMVFDSAGTRAPNAKPPSMDAASFLRMEKIDILRHRSKPLNDHLADSADLILPMTAANVEEVRELLDPHFHPKVVLLNEAIDMSTRNMDVLPPRDSTVASLRRTYASLLASVGRLVRTLEDSGVCPEWFGAKTVERKFKVGSRSTNARASAATIDPEKRRYLANFLFDFLERAFEPPTISHLMEAVHGIGHHLGQSEVEEILRQDLHSYARQDRQGCWILKHDATARRREAARQSAQARNASTRTRAREAIDDENAKLTPELAFTILGIGRTTGQEEARRKYRALLKRYHPDKFHDDEDFRQMAERKARRINEAWDLIKDSLDNDE